MIDDSLKILANQTANIWSNRKAMKFERFFDFWLMMPVKLAGWKNDNEILIVFLYIDIKFRNSKDVASIP